MTAIAAHLRYGKLFGSLSDDEARQIVAACRRVRLDAGTLACRQGEAGESMFVIVRGRVSVEVEQPDGSRRVVNYLRPGDHFGEMSLLVGGSRSASVTAVTDTELLELTRGDFDQIIARVPGFAVNLCRSLGEWLRGQISGGRRHERMQTAVVRATPAADTLATQMAARVAREGGHLQVLSDRPLLAARWSTGGNDWRALDVDRSEAPLLNALSAAVAGNERTLVDLEPRHATAKVLAQQELVYWVVGTEPTEQQRGLAQLSELLNRGPAGLADRVQVVEAIPASEELPPAIDLQQAELDGALVHPVMRIEYTGEGPQAEFQQRDVVRLVRQMRGLQVGLALGGGGARGIAHIGVLDVFQREGIYFDRLAGTSAGAIVAAAHAAGIPLERVQQVFEREMTPPPAIAWLPKARQWYMLAVFRLGLAELKFRRYLHHYQFEQLLTPAELITVDLISGEHRIRSTGDLVGAVLESINHPVFGAPIMRDGEALVDGGVLMNLPVTALRERQVDFSVAVDVSKKLSRRFAGNTRETTTEQMRRPGYFSTLLRVTDVELINLAALHAADCDFLIAPETADFPFDDFTQAEGLVDAGRRAAEAELPRLTEALDRVLAWPRPAQTAAAAAERASPRAA